MTRPDRYFDTDGWHPYERTEQEVRERCLYGDEGRLYTRVSYEPLPIGFTIHVGGRSGAREYVLQELRDKIQRELDEDFNRRMAESIARGPQCRNPVNGVCRCDPACND